MLSAAPEGVKYEGEHRRGGGRNGIIVEGKP